MDPKKLAVALAAIAVASLAHAAESVSTAPGSPSAPAFSGTTTSSAPDHPRGPRYKASFSYITSRSSSKDFRSFKSAATDDSGQLTDLSVLPNLNYVSARLSVSPVERHTISGGLLESIDGADKRTISRSGRPGDDSFTLPSTILSLRYGYRIDDHWNAGLSEIFNAPRRFIDPMAGLTYRSKTYDEQGIAHRVGLNVSAPTTERSHNDQLITRATARTSIAYVAGPWITSAGIAYSRPFYAHPDRLAPTNFGDPSQPGNQMTAGQPSTRPHRHNGHVVADDPSVPPPPPFIPEEADIATQEREADRTTSSVGVSYQPNNHWRFSSGAGVTYVETWRQKTIWLTNARPLAAAYSFWKMEVGSDVALYSDIHKFQHPSLPSLFSVGLHLTYFMGAERQAQL